MGAICAAVITTNNIMQNPAADVNSLWIRTVFCAFSVSKTLCNTFVWQAQNTTPAEERITNRVSEILNSCCVHMPGWMLDYFHSLGVSIVHRAQVIYWTCRSLKKNKLHIQSSMARNTSGQSSGCSIDRWVKWPSLWHKPHYLCWKGTVRNHRWWFVAVGYLLLWESEVSEFFIVKYISFGWNSQKGDNCLVLRS